MRTGPRIVLACVLLSAALCAPARAADTLNVFVDNNEIALGGVTTLAAHAETDAAYGGGHVAFKYKQSAEDCAPSPAADAGTEAPDSRIPAGAGVADVGGQTLELAVGSWRVCGWLIDDAAATPVAVASTIVTVVPYSGSVSVSVRKTGRAFQIVFNYTTSAPARLYASLQHAGRACANKPGRGIQILPREGRLVASDGGLGRSVPASSLAAGRWRVCAWLQAPEGAAGPATKAFAVPRQPRRRAGHAAG